MVDDGWIWLSQPWLILASFFIFLVLMHAVLIYLRPLSSKGWRRADYIWLSGAFLSLVGLTAEARQQWIDLRRPIAEQLHQGTIDELRDTLLLLQVFMCRAAGPVGPGQPPADPERPASGHEGYCRWLAERELALEEAFRGRRRVEVERSTAGGERFADAPAASDGLRRIRELVAEYNESLVELAYWSRLDVSDTERFVKGLSPILLAFALALRVTKVTGQIKLGG